MVVKPLSGMHPIAIVKPSVFVKSIYIYIYIYISVIEREARTLEKLQSIGSTSHKYIHDECAHHPHAQTYQILVPSSPTVLPPPASVSPGGSTLADVDSAVPVGLPLLSNTLRLNLAMVEGVVVEVVAGFVDRAQTLTE